MPQEACGPASRRRSRGTSPRYRPPARTPPRRRPGRRALRTPSASSPRSPLSTSTGRPALRFSLRYREREGLARENLRAGQLAAEADQERLEREAERELQLLGVPP